MRIPEKRKSTKKYDNQLKLSIAREYFTSDLGYGGLGKKHNIPSATIQDFIRWYKKKYPDGVIETSSDEAIQPVDKDLAEANLKMTALQMLIENASKELGIDLVKKFGTKQPGK